MSGSGPTEISQLFYRESPFERIVDVHWKKKKPDDGGGPPPEFPLPPCGDLFYDGNLPDALAGVGIIHINLGAVASATGEGTWIQPTDMPPIDWTQIGPPTWDYSNKGTQIYIPGNGASSVRIMIHFAAPTAGNLSAWWVRPGKSWMDPSIWDRPFTSPAGPPDGYGDFDMTFDRNPITPDPDNPNNFGTTLQFYSNVSGGGIIMTVEHNDCPPGAPTEVPPHP
jgi:hypothetical protein